LPPILSLAMMGSAFCSNYLSKSPCFKLRAVGK
jgi:hypothetical protein